MASGKVVITVDETFFNNIFEKNRKKLQTKLGVNNLTQANFTKLIKDVKLVKIKEKNIKSFKKRGKKRNDLFMF